MWFLRSATYLGLTHVLCLCLAGCSRFDPSQVPPLGNRPDRLMNASELIEYYGYEAMSYQVTTEDGYILGLTRIGNNSGPPVLMINGLGLGRELWVLHGKGHDLPFVLHDLGYDVWLGGPRGLFGSLEHVTYNMDSSEYWDFSHDESGYYDLPAMMDLILAESGHKKIFYVGISYGGTLMMVLCSERPEYCDLIAGNVQFVPAMWLSPSQQLPVATQGYLDLFNFMVKLYNEFGREYFFKPSSIYQSMMMNICGTRILDEACFLSLHHVTGFVKNNIVEDWLGYTLAWTASGASTRQVKHYMQVVEIGGARKYDYGATKNLMVYGTMTPPSYNLTRITSPTIIYYSESDVFVPETAMRKTISLIGNLHFARPAPDPTYGHAEHVFGKNLYLFYYSEIVDFFDSLSNIS